MRMIAAALLASVGFAQNVPYSRILEAHKEPQNWLTYSGNYNGQRHSQLDQINVSNVKRLKVAWVHHTNTTESHETTPLVVDGVMFLTEGPNVVKSIDTRTGNVLWRYEKQIPKDLRLCCGRPNRGVAILGDTVYYGSIDAHVIALDARTGRVKWDVEMADYKLGYSSTVAPLAVKDKIILGVAGGEFGIRGFIDAYDSKTGKRAWRFYTIPGPGDPEFGTWEGDSWKTGSSSIWTTGSFDSASNTTIWGTGNPGPDWNGDVRKGDNLYACSFVALDVDSGKKKWHFQFTPHDTHDWDATQVPVLIDGQFRGTPKKMVVTANRNAFFYVLDRENGKFLTGKPFVRQTWAKGLDDSGRPMVIPGTDPTEEGNLVWPSLAGGTNWASPSYSPQTKLFYAPVREQGAYYYKGEADYKPGVIFNGGGQRVKPDEEPYGAIRALDPETGNLKWEFKVQIPLNVGVLTTKSNLLFSGTGQGDFFALNAATGELLWRFKTNGGINAGPMSYAVDGRQYIAMAIGRALYVFDLMEN
ncbi:MAG TPA: PQQ-dependent dehydrogenase, methanol/ethanol family [Bryobacteraceae bacterium]|nr:PQQ-dependent dehydrogenase, methanol/ethanol family [Bryobacteraceae bacterium]